MDGNLCAFFTFHTELSTTFPLVFQEHSETVQDRGERWTEKQTDRCALTQTVLLAGWLAAMTDGGSWVHRGVTMETSITATLSLSTLDKPICTCSTEECSVGSTRLIFSPPCLCFCYCVTSQIQQVHNRNPDIIGSQSEMRKKIHLQLVTVSPGKCVRTDT